YWEESSHRRYPIRGGNTARQKIAEKTETCAINNPPHLTPAYSAIVDIHSVRSVPDASSTPALNPREKIASRRAVAMSV
ncbi:hypothetical protein, partial [Halobacterium salinarum]|uniref:hypothetical protein n=1 Tax=Halobacterium salinarum TaxID=2242 RepID=UPI002552B2A3